VILKGIPEPLRNFNVLRSRLSLQVPAQLFGTEPTNVT
jgi:hypothetical protein